MYAASIVEERLQLARDEFGFTVDYKSVEEVDAFESRLHREGKYLLDDTGRPASTQNLSPSNQQWMLNEQVLCMCDAAYALTRYCNPPEAPIWMGDFTFKPIGEVQVGDIVMGWERVLRSSQGAWRGTLRESWKRSKVLAISRRIAPIVRVTLASGRVIRCTPDHLWSSGNYDRSKRPWIRARVGWNLRRLVNVYSNEPSHPQRAAWLGGLYDGEGSRHYIAQDKIHNPKVHAHIAETLRVLGFHAGVMKNGKVISINGGAAEMARFLAWCRPIRFESLERYIFSQHSTLKGDKDSIVSVEPDGEGEVVSMQTETGNYVAWGYASKNCFIKNEENIIQRFRFRIPQRLLFDIICDLEEMRASIEIMILKARQLGMSTLVELLIALRIIFAHGVNAVIGSADQTKTSLMANMLFLAYDMMPIWLRPSWTRRVESDRGMLVFGHTASGVSFQHGAQTSGIARGTTPTIYHLSECASFTDPVNQIEASLFKAVHASPSVFGILESTGEGDKGWWPDTYRHAKANWVHRRSRLCPLFLPWFCGTDIYPTSTWLRMRPIPSDWRPNRNTRTHVAKAELYVHSDKLLSRHLGVDYKMPRAQQWFWEVEHEQAKAKNIEGVFLQEMAGDDEEALQRSSESVFGHDTIDQIRVRRKKTFECYTITGQSIEESHEVAAEFYDYSRERIPVRFTSNKQETFRWEFIPLRDESLREDQAEDVDGILLIFHHPEPGVSYSIGVDTSEGKGQDSTVISVWTCGKKGDPDIQVAEFSSSRVNHVEAFAFVLAISAYYKTHMAIGQTRWKEPYLSIEQVAAVGDTCQLQLARMGYTNFHKMARYDSSVKRIIRQKKTGGKRGWFTFSYTRAMLTGNFVHAAQNGWAEINSPWLINEMKEFEVHVTSSGKEKLEHADDSHDDRIFASAMAIFCPHDMDQLADRSKKRFVESSALPPLNLGPSPSGLLVNPDHPMHRTTSSIEDLLYNEGMLERLSR